MAKKYFSIVKNKDLTNIKAKLTNTFGLPEISKRLSVYAFNENNDEIHIEFKGKDKYITYLSRGEDHALIKNNKFIFKNLKAFLKLIHRLGFTECSTGEIIENIFKRDRIEITISNNTFIGNILSFEARTLETKKIIEKILGKNYKIEEAGSIGKYTKGLEIPRKPLINHFNVVNEDIVQYADSVGLDIRSFESTLQSKIESFSNDYSSYEKPYLELTKSNLLESTANSNDLILSPVSIIIPCYNSEDTILQTLFSIESQNLNKAYLKNIEVVVVDDGSKVQIFNTIDPYISEFTFKLNIIRLSNNRGLSTARNIGIKAITNDILIFIDSDIILSKNYIKEHVIRSSMIPNAIFVSFKENIEKNSELNSIDRIKKGVDASLSYDDLRVNRHIEKGKVGVVKAEKSIDTEILADTNYFKDLGYGRRIGVLDLPSMVIGHNFSTRKKILEEIGGFSNYFKGWGMEDSYFGAKAIANGNFIIPVIATGVYHINHVPRSGSEEKKQKELRKNLKIYKSLITSEI